MLLVMKLGSLKIFLQASQPQQGGLGTRDQNIDRYVTEQIKSPELASSATQSYTQQAVQSNELLAGNQQAAPTDCRHYYYWFIYCNS